MKIRKFIENLKPEEIEEKNLQQIKENDEFFKEFKDAHEKKCCVLCGNKLDYFSDFEPCFHWFLLPTGIKKKHFKKYLFEAIGYYKLESYFRWIATLESPLKNINDLTDEKSGSKLKEITIKYENIEWSMNFGKSDLDGHKDSNYGKLPHFHIQMLIDDKPFIRFNDFHIPFSKEDLFTLQMMEEAADLISLDYYLGAGMSFIEKKENLIELDKVMTLAEDENKATFNTSSFLQMPEGKTIKEEEIEKFIKESKETKTPLRKIMNNNVPDIKIITEIRPGNSVPKMKKRSSRK
jgi:DNA-directed RNA polymerase subunit H (RpoH/RPB5)